MGLVGFAALLALPLQAQAQTAYVSNIGQSENATALGITSFDQGQGFTTGTDSAGYVLASVDIKLESSKNSESTGSQIPTVTIVQGTPTGTVVATLMNPASLAANTTADYTFTAPANTTLSASTTYYVVMEGGIAGISTARTSLDVEDSGGESDWSIADVSNWRSSSSNGSFSTNANALMIKVKGPGGTPLSTDATLSDLELFDNNGNTITLSPTFMSGTTSYTRLVDNSVNEITIIPENNDDNATYEIQDGSSTALVDADSVEDDFQVTLSVGENTIKVEVTAEDTTTQTYTVVVTRRMSTTTPPAPAEVEVLYSWSLKPTGLGAGDKFRLLFLSSTETNATSFDIADYNSFIQGRAAAGHTDIRTYSSGFRAVGCTADSDATANTGTAGTGEVIYWLGGNKAADNYGDFYDGSWDEEVNDKDESGNDGPNTFQQGNYPFTGCADNGTESLSGTTSYALGTAGGSVRVGRPNSSTSGDGPISGSNSLTGVTSNRPMYGLSPVFEVAANAAPTFTDGTSTTREFLIESIGDATADAVTRTNIGQPVTATDTDMGDTLEYGLEGTDAAKFTIDTTTGQIRDKGGENYDYETKASYSVTVTVMDDNGGSDTIAVTLNVMDQDEAPLKPGLPSVVPVVASTTTLDVNWTDRDNTGRPNIDTYDLQYREGTSGSWTNGPQNVTGTSSTIGSLMADTLYQVQIRATNAEGDSAWSESGSGTTGAPVMPTVSISADKTTAVFKEDAIVYTLTRTGSTTAALPVTVMLTQTKDFLARAELSKTVTIAVGQSTKTFTVAASSFQHFATGTLVEAGTLTATVQDGADYDLGTPSSVNVAIVIGMTVRFDMASYSVGEAAGTLPFMLIARTGPGAPRPTADYDLGEYYTDATNGTALLNVDFNESGSPLSFPVGDFSASGGVWQAEQAFSITINEDALDEDDETFDILLERRISNSSISVVDASGNSCGSVCTVTVTITDDDTATPPSGTALVSNLGQTDGDFGTLISYDQAQAFTTGDNFGGYALTSVEIQTTGTPTLNALTVSIHSDSSGSPDASLGTLTNPGSVASDGIATFTASGAGIDLERETTYFVVVDVTTGTTGNIQNTASDAEDAGAAANWSIGNGSLYRNKGQTGAWLTYVQSKKIRINGTAKAGVASTDADLTGLALKDTSDDSTVTLSPGFATATKSYTADVGNDVAAVTVEPALSDSNATVAYLDGSDTVLTDAETGTTGFQTALFVGETTIKVKVTAEDDLTTETYTVVVTRTAATGTTVVTIAADAPTAIYNEIGASFTVTRTGATTDPLDVVVALTQTKQFLEAGELSRTVTIAAGSASNTLSISSDDLLLADTETRESGTLTATVQAGTGYNPGTTATASVDVVVALTVSFDELSYSVDEGVGTLQVTLVARTGVGAPVPGSAFFSVSTAELNPPEAVSPEDYGAVSVTVEIPASAYMADGDVFRAEVPVDVVIVDDARDEPAERLHLELEITPGLESRHSNFTDPDGVGCRNPRCSMPITIEDNDATPTVTLVLTPPSITENGGVSQITATLDHPSSEMTTIQISAAAVAPAVAGDFALTSLKRLTVRAGDTENTGTGSVALQALNNAVYFGNKSVTISGTATNVMGIVQPQAQTLTIEDDEEGTATDATLSGLALKIAADDSTVALSPVFAPATTSYTAMVGIGVDEITVAPTENDSEATVAYLDGSDTALADTDVHKAGFQAALAEGANTIKVKVTAADRATTGTYTVVVTRETAATDAALTGLALKNAADDSAVTLSPGFATATKSYTALVANTVLSITVESAKSDSNAAVAYLDFANAARVDADPIKPGFQVALGEGPNTINVQVTAEDGHTTDTYTVVVTRGANTDATGQPAIAGPAQVGRTLTAELGTIADIDGLPDNFPRDYDFQWVRVDADGMETDIFVATSNTYTPLAADVGKKVKVEVSFTAGDGSVVEGPLPSDATNPVAPAAATCPTDAATIWCTTLTVGHYLEEVDGDIEVVEAGYDTVSSSIAYGSLGGATFRHLGVDYTVTSLHGGATQDLYFATTPNLPADGVGLTVHVQKYVGELDTPLADGVFQSDNLWFFQGALNTSASSGDTLSDAPLIHAPWSRDQVVPDPPDLGTEVMVRLSFANRPAEGAPTISGTPQVGGTVEAGIGDIADADGLPDDFPEDYTFQWLRVDADGVSNETAIGADVEAIRLAELDAGKKVKVKVSFTDDGGNVESLTSDAFPSGTGTTITLPDGNLAPVFNGGATQSRTLAETVGDAVVGTAAGIGGAVSATDANSGDTLTYSLEGADEDKFDLDDSNGQIKTKVGERYDYEAKQSYAVTVVVTDGAVSVSAAVTINITNNANETPPAPDAPTVTPTSGSTTSLDVSWTAPANTGRPTITGYDLQYRVDGESSWTDGPQGVSGTSASIAGLAAGTSYEVQVRAVNTDGAGAWSGAGDGNTTPPTPTVRFGASAYTAIEGLAGTVVTVLLDPAASSAVTILVTTTPQDGASSADYDGVPPSVTFAAGETEQSFTVTATDDTVDDDGESLQLGFDALPSGVLLGSPATATVALVEDVDVSTWFLFFEESSYTATEGGTAARVTVGLSNPWKPELNESLTIGIFTPEHRGGADAADYSGVPEQVTFRPGQTRVSFTVTATNDSDDDDGESIYLQSAGFDIEDLELGRGPRAATVHLRDNDGASAVQAFFGEQTYRVNEGSAVDVSVHLDKAPGRALTLLITTAHGNGASSADYSGVPESITFSSSQSTRTFAVQAQNDNVNDDQEYLTFGFGELPASVSAGDPATTTLNLVDTNDSISIRTISFDGQDTNVRELLEGSIYSLYVYLNSAADNDIVVPLQVTHLDGATPADYSGLPETVIIPAGERRENVIIRVLEDTEDDHGEGIRVGFGSLPRGVRKDNQADTATFRFLDNDTLPAISIAGADVKEWPNPQSYLRFVASLDYAPEFEVAVDYRTVNGTAVAGQDYESASGTLTFAEGERSKYIRVRVCHDGIDESTETMTLQLSNPVRTKLEGNGSATGSIRNNNGSGAKPCATGISVSDVSYPEPNINHLRRQKMQFEVSLNQADTGTVTVDYQTVNGTATAGQDYESASGTLTFRPGQTRRTVKVVVVADTHDDPGETFTLRLSNPSGAYIGDGEGTATLTNSGLMPGAWLSRFGRVASDHAVQAIEARIYDTSGHARENHLTIGGQRVDWQMLGRFAPSGPVQRGDRASPDGVAPRFDPWLGDQAARTRMDRLGAEAMAVGSLSGEGMADLDAGGSPASGSPAIDSLSGEGMAGVDSGRVRGSGGGDAKGTFRRAVMELLGLEDFSRLSEAGAGLMGSSFFYSRPGGDEAPGWLGPWSLWGETAVTRFDGAEGPLSLNGDVTTATVGFDTRRERWMAGLALAYSEGQGAYTHRIATGGAMDSSLTSLIPYASYSLNERTSVWGTLGYGVGDLTLTPEGAASGIETGLSTSMAAFGGRGVFSVRTAGAAQFEFAVRADARLTSTVSDAVENLAGAAGATSRVRAVLEGRGSVPLAWGGDLSPRLEVGLRYDGGDAETGAGLEIGGGLGYAAGRLSVEVTARGLVAHQDTEYEEWGFSGSIAYTPSEDGRGLSVRLGSAWGATQSGVQSLWNQQDASGLARNAAFEAALRFEAELGYGIAGRRRNSLWVPFIAAQAADGGGQALQMGVRLASESSLEAELRLGRRQGRPGAAPEHAVQLHGALRW